MFDLRLVVKQAGNRIVPPDAVLFAKIAGCPAQFCGAVRRNVIPAGPPFVLDRRVEMTLALDKLVCLCDVRLVIANDAIALSVVRAVCSAGSQDSEKRDQNLDAPAAFQEPIEGCHYLLPPAIDYVHEEVRRTFGRPAVTAKLDLKVTPARSPRRCLAALG